ncbi:HAMP domain-containing sensor histidine kinase [Bacillus sp. UNCCL81]|uniref:sensor histidine kinase n=1 Tax=Bacillus sp. UNCCL81 TaxID=1502755 RepID=UPI0008EDBBFB|nr:HAMP domain-containing sensor histidine kinase [Bacillus sp. UNCCL81]SFD56528.1 His Kinase A (phospho-acceptor) domain-containing protein [Bacillus sp. UNCCL81]
MFKKLRNKFLLINMSVISLVMVVAFTIIYIMTYNNIQNENKKKLDAQTEKLITIQREIKNKEIGSELKNNNDIKGKVETKKEITNIIGKGGIVTQKISLGDSVSFSVEVDSTGNVIEGHSFISMPTETFKKATEIALENKKNFSTFTLDGKKWQYVIKPAEMIVNQMNEQPQIINKVTLINFLDVTDSHKALFKLLTTLISVGLITLFVIYFISRYFANRAIEPIAEAWKKQNQFVTDASHELKTPLAIINANYDVLMAHKEETIENQQKWFNHIKVGSDRMTKLINSLLTLTKMEEAIDEINLKHFDLSKELHEVMISMETVLKEKKIILKHSIETNLMIESDPDKIKQLMIILFDNAVKYTNKHGQIEVTLTKLKRQVKFAIKNSGNGIPAKDLPKVFDRFYRSDPSRAKKTEGYGLGLSIAQSITNRLGGTISVSSIENEYTNFIVLLDLS